MISSMTSSQETEFKKEPLFQMIGKDCKNPTSTTIKTELQSNEMKQQETRISMSGLKNTNNTKNSGFCPEPSHCPSLLETVQLGSELAMRKWADINNSSSDSSGLHSMEYIAERIFAILLIRILALLSRRGLTPNLPTFSDLSTSSICHAILCHWKLNNGSSSFDSHQEENAQNANCHQENKGPNEEIQKEYRSSENDLDWPDAMTNEVFSELYQYIYQILQSYRSVSYHNREHAFHVFISAHKLLDMVLCEYDYSHGTCSPVKKQTRVTYGLKSDPLAQLAYLFSALVHDVDHTGVSNRQLVLESDELAILYNDQSVAEQRSLAIAFSLLMTRDFQTLRQVIFQSGEYMKFRKIVIDLVLCTDIASPERVQIVKSKWKEAFGDKSHNMNSPVKLGSASLNTIHPVQSYHENMNGHGEDVVGSPSSSSWPKIPQTPAGMVESVENLSEEMNISPDPSSSDRRDSRAVVRENSLSFSERKKRNAWKSEPADDSLRNPGKLRLVYYFFAQRGSMMTGKRLQSRNSRASCDSENVISKKKKKQFLRSLKWKAARNKNVKKNEPAGDEEPENSKEAESPMLSGPVNTQPNKKDRNVESDEEKDETDIFHKKNNTQDEMEKIKDILNEYEEDLSVSSALSDSSASPVENSYRNEILKKYVPKRRVSEDVTKILSSCKHEFEREQLHDRSCRNNSITTCSTVESASQHPNHLKAKSYRRFTEPANPCVDRKKFHLRLGIRRALDLTGNQINDYRVESEISLENDPDHPDELKMIVVLEQMMKAADVAANMQGWDTMISWSNRLFKELKTSYDDGRGEDPVTEWHENQIAFFESYTMPLACRLVETGIFEFHEVQELVNGVRQNNIRWMIEGRLVLDRMIHEWEVLQKAKNARKRAVSNVGF